MIILQLSFIEKKEEILWYTVMLMPSINNMLTTMREKKNYNVFITASHWVRNILVYEVMNYSHVPKISYEQNHCLLLNFSNRDWRNLLTYIIYITSIMKLFKPKILIYLYLKETDIFPKSHLLAISLNMLDYFCSSHELYCRKV